MTAPLTTLRATGALRAFEAAGVLAPADVHVASRLGRLGGETSEPVLLATALTVRALRLGSVCVELGRLPDLAADAGDLPWPDPSRLTEAVRRSPLMTGGAAGPLTPLTLVDTPGGPLLFLTRYHRQEEIVRTALADRERDRPAVDLGAAAAALAALFPGPAPDRQRVAAALAATEWTTIVAGGPGTGKTHTAARILALLFALHGPALRVALAAPTGKAAARLQESIGAQAEELGLPAGLVATTLHRLLGPRRDSRGRFTHHAHNRLPHDVIVLDETSMVSLTMMARLAEAVRPATRLILLGDPDQLASVDAGAVLADLVARPPARPPGPALARLVPGDLGAEGFPDAERDQLGNAVIRLRHGHRFGAGIAALADAVRRGAADEAMAVLTSGDETVDLRPPDDLAGVRDDVVTTGLALLDAAERGDLTAALAALGTHRLLCAHREGPSGVGHWSRRSLAWLSRASGRVLDPDRRYPGLPLLVTENDDDAGLSNGDTGVVVRRDGGLVAAFDRGAGPLLVHPARLSSVHPAYAMTIHRSQGSQYDSVTVVLPDETSAILTRQLLYTAITRARRRVRIVGRESAVRAALGRPALRASGIGRTP
ncbi:RecBCD enzyme subunit RecD [Amycolatopsis deserti]|uniref:RecBCD enzyme subunit RecD n=1 Tax=Amycolatopsis deserti TaxID=185696 RepID=A0ABQ3IEJ7_9PSEU|nr:exodeoxyribonuclease V subunit alpha [Amycolatopsis deserti]GHE78011.1 RecBCD enzyme subunit RecD [Amycolatopsis deserti]